MCLAYMRFLSCHCCCCCCCFVVVAVVVVVGRGDVVVAVVDLDQFWCKKVGGGKGKAALATG